MRNNQRLIGEVFAKFFGRIYEEITKSLPEKLWQSIWAVFPEFEFTQRFSKCHHSGIDCHKMAE